MSIQILMSMFCLLDSFQAQKSDFNMLNLILPNIGHAIKLDN